ncbi:hypothetical protein BRC86_08275 [Halobacteriales archaeon QS_3_64_16]|nr:MAG: hypothetical protein BRC86_08275 [Halobacteriales archaeon QS_3_64_16]
MYYVFISWEIIKFFSDTNSQLLTMYRSVTFCKLTQGRVLPVVSAIVCLLSSCFILMDMPEMTGITKFDVSRTLSIAFSIDPMAFVETVGWD